MTGETTSLSAKNITVQYSTKGKVTTKAFSLTQKQYDAALGRSIQKESSVKVCYDGNMVKGNILNLAPAG